MSEEVFEIVNERDEVIGQQLRSEVHRLGLMHRAVHVLIYNQRGELFLQKRSLNKDSCPGLWDSSASGHSEVGESYDDCALREVFEELGFQLSSVPNRLFKIAACPETGQEFVWVYRAQADGPFMLNEDEIETGGWFTDEQITRWTTERPDEFAGGFLLIWRTIQSDRGESN